MAWYDENSLLTRAFSPHPSTIIITLLIAILLPILLHFFIYRPSLKISTPRFVILGPSESGKTALVAQLERGELSQTHTSLSPNTVEVTLPSTFTASSSKYRSDNDAQPPKKILLADTPGHPKLRHMALETLDDGSKAKNINGVIFLVDSAAISSEGSSTAELTETAVYLHDVLLRLQKHSLSSKGKAKDVPFLIAANKMDLFTALPEQLVKATLQEEITKLRETRSKGIASITQSTSAEGMNFGSQNATDDDDEGDVLGGNAAGKFEFALLQEYGIDVTVLGGTVSEGEKGVEKWWDWIAELL